MQHTDFNGKVTKPSFFSLLQQLNYPVLVCQLGFKLCYLLSKFSLNGTPFNIPIILSPTVFNFSMFNIVAPSDPQLYVIFIKKETNFYT